MFYYVCERATNAHFLKVVVEVVVELRKKQITVLFLEEKENERKRLISISENATQEA